MLVDSKDLTLSVDKLIQMYRSLESSSSTLKQYSAEEYSLLEESKIMILREINKILKENA